MAKKKTSKPEVVTPSEMAAFAESLENGRPVARKTAKKKVRSGAVRPGRTDDPRQMSLPGMADIWRAMPNHLAGSSLFVPVVRGRKKLLDRVELVSRADVKITFSGRQLDESDADVWMQAMHEASKLPLGESVTIVRADFLRALGRDTGKSQYLWLDRAMDNLFEGSIRIMFEPKKGRGNRTIGDRQGLHLIDDYSFDSEKDSYTLTINRRWKALYDGNRYSLISWPKRLEFKPQQDVAKSLQRLIATSKDEIQRNAVSWLQERLGISKGSIREFRRVLRKAFVELERLKIIADPRFETSTRGGEQVVWTRL